MNFFSPIFLTVEAISDWEEGLEHVCIVPSEPNQTKKKTVFILSLHWPIEVEEEKKKVVQTHSFRVFPFNNLHTRTLFKLCLLGFSV